MGTRLPLIPCGCTFPVTAGKDKIALAVGKVINKKKVAKHVVLDITDDGLAWRRD